MATISILNRIPTKNACAIAHACYADWLEQQPNSTLDVSWAVDVYWHWLDAWEQPIFGDCGTHTSLPEEWLADPNDPASCLLCDVLPLSECDNVALHAAIAATASQAGMRPKETLAYIRACRMTSSLQILAWLGTLVATPGVTTAV